jgi:hypothetical protein
MRRVVSGVAVMRRVVSGVAVMRRVVSGAAVMRRVMSGTAVMRRVVSGVMSGVTRKHLCDGSHLSACCSVVLSVIGAGPVV